MNWLSALIVGLAIPSAALAQDGTWPTFNGNLAAQKYAPAAEITPENVSKLEKIWDYHTCDMSDGSGNVPATVWSGTPIYANETLYIGTPFYRIIALDPETGAEKWVFDTQSELAPLTQPELKNRGVTYWEAEAPIAGQPCQKRVYIGTMDSRR